MNKNLHSIDNLFKKSIDSHWEEVPSDVWNNIDHNLDKKQAAFYKRRYFAVCAAAILVISIGGVTIAAVLHFRQHEKILSGNSSNEVVTSSGRKDNRTEENATQEDGSKDRIIEREKGYNQNTKLNSRCNEAIKFKPVIKSSVDLAVHKQNGSNEKEKEQTNNSLMQTEAIKETKHTSHVDVNLLNIEDVDLATSLSASILNSSPISLFTNSSNEKIIGLRSHSRRWSISPMYTQNVNLNTLRDDDQIRDSRINSREAKRTEQETISFSMGIGIQRQIRKNFVLQSGIQYVSSRTNIQPKTIFAKTDANGEIHYHFPSSFGNSFLPANFTVRPNIGDSIKADFSRVRLSYLQIPLMMSYQINADKFLFSPSAGLYINHLLNGKLKSSLKLSNNQEETLTTINGLRSLYISATIQPQLGYTANRNILLYIYPGISFSLLSINSENAVKKYRNTISFGTGIRILL